MTTAHTPRLDATANQAGGLLARWPLDEPLGAHIAGDPQRKPGFSLYARPESIEHPVTLDEFASLIRSSQSCIQPTPTFGPGWLVSINYNAGHQIEPSASAAPAANQGPFATLARIESGYIVNNQTGETTTFGAPPRLLVTSDHRQAFTLGSAQGLEREAVYTNAVGKAVELIRAGDVFQVNLTHRLHAAFAGSARALMASLAETLRPWHGFYLETPSASQSEIAAICSLSPELFLDLAPDGLVRTRPMKGTRPGKTPAAELELADKDKAELAMIVDLMRNDLGRVCRFGSVKVTQNRTIEPHGGTSTTPSLWQGVATVEGTLRDGLDVRDLLAACFPPGSVTGAPKVRAMQIIDELEPALGFDDSFPRRGPYCGACGFIGDDGSASLNVAIRTAIITGQSAGTGRVESGAAHYPVGAGIVADSDPASEWQETLDKAKPFLDLCKSGGEPGRDITED
ncbi:MAG: anthranilate synthase component I family protein [Phycisphaerales bacterium JB061]